MVLVEGLFFVCELIIILPGLGDLRWFLVWRRSTALFDATRRECLARAASGTPRMIITDAVGRDKRRKKGDKTMIIAASGSDMADSFVSNCKTPSKFPESLISSDVTGNNFSRIITKIGRLQPSFPRAHPVLVASQRVDLSIMAHLAQRLGS